MSLVLNLGCGLNPVDGAVNHDIRKHSCFVDCAHDLNRFPWPWGDCQFSRVIAQDVMEHLKCDISDWMDELWRIVDVYGSVSLRVPRFDHPNAYIDPTHQRLFARETLCYWMPGNAWHEKYGRYYFCESNKWWHVESTLENDSVIYELTKLPLRTPLSPRGDKLASMTAAFVHVAKCGGSSVSSVFSRYKNLHVVECGYDDRFKDRYVIHDACVEDDGGILEYGPFSPADLDFSFAFVRNPYSRLASMFRVMDSKRPEGISMDHVLHIASMDWVPRSTENCEISDHTLWIHIRPASEFIHLLSAVDVVVKREDYFGKRWIEQKLGIEDFPVLNVSPGKRIPNSELFTRRQQEQVKQIYSKDLEMWGYEIDS